MSTLFPKVISYIRNIGGYVDGIWTPGTDELLQFIGSVQPMNEREINSLPVGRQDAGKVKIYSDTPLAVSVEGGDNSGDVVLWNGKRWEVIMENNYNNDIISHYKYIGEYRGKV